MKFFITVLLIAMATATLASSLSPADQIVAVKTFLHDLAPHLQNAKQQILGTEDEPEASGGYANDEIAAASAPDEGPAAYSEDSESSIDDELPLQSVEIETAVDFRPFPEQTRELTGAATAPPRISIPEPPQAEPLAREEVSEVIRRLGRVSRTAARSTTGRIR